MGLPGAASLPTDPREALLLERVARLEEAGRDEDGLATALGELVDYYWAVGRHRSAEAPMLRRLRLFERTRGSEHTTVARCLHDLAFLYDTLSRDTETEDAAARALALWIKIDGYANGHATRMLELLARSYAKQRRHDALAALVHAALPQLEVVYPRGSYDRSLATLADLLIREDLGADLHGIAARVRALLD